ncbi:hypothetical protein EYR41_010098 [Orbilia oligospora]|uniref:Uncharacterized protein n=1 Tax=Orbilia oligospora TaxID=2813651 RepID=A0A7C8PAN2_ORBOL|nr:hypothetical protein TWF751_006450 [Orbilia oligospora]TGJ64015.1 hypothetical protein EYR41_010098 [Orbilia oligospora]
MESEGDWKVDNWQIPVPLGDCSVHLLVKNRKIERAFIMDGGKKADGIDPAVPILNTLSLIDKKYGTNWVLNRWVVTHWDEDHYEGVLSLLESEESDIFRTKTKRRGKPRPQEYKTFRSAYFCAIPELYCGAEYEHLNSDKVVERIKKVINSVGWGEVIAGRGLLRRDLFTGRFWPPDTDCSAELKELAGSNKKPLTGLGTGKKKTINQLDGAPSPDFGDAPHFTVLGAGGFALAPQTANVTFSGPFKEGSTISKNETSILSLIHWPRPDTKAAYFTGGDGNPDAELNAIIPLLNLYEKLPVNTFKLDHHGSSKENIQKTNAEDPPKDASLRDVWPKNQGALKPEKEDKQGLEVIRQLQPRNILVTPGNQYGHPTFDVITLLSCCRFEDEIRPVLHTTRSPYWMLKPPSGKDINLGHFEALEDVHLEARNIMFEEKALVTLLGAQAELHDEVLGSNEEYTRAYDGFKKYYQEVCGAKDPPTWLEAIAEVERQQKNTIKELKEFYNKKNYKGEEPSWSSFLDSRDIVQEYREQIQDISKTHWGTLSGQTVEIDQLPYYLVRFTFDESAEPEIDIMDETGNIVPTGEPGSQEQSFYSESDSEDEYSVVDPGSNKKRIGTTDRDSTQKINDVPRLHTYKLRSEGQIKKSKILAALAIVNLPDEEKYKLFEQVYQYTEDLVENLLLNHSGDKLVVDYKCLRLSLEKELEKIFQDSGSPEITMMTDEIHHHLRRNYFQRAKETRDIVDTPSLNAGEITYYLRTEDVIDIFGDTRGSRMIKPRKPKNTRKKNTLKK